MTESRTDDLVQVCREEASLVERLRARDEAAFVELVRLHGPSMLRVAMLYVRTRAVAEEVVQEAWLGVLKGIDRFEGRSSLKTWIFRILTNVAKTRSEREGRSLPFSSRGDSDLEPGESSVDVDRFLPDADRWGGHWASTPRRFEDMPERRLLSEETKGLIQQAARDPAGRDHDARRRRLRVRRGLRGARHQRGQPARAFASGAHESAHCP